MELASERSDRTPGGVGSTPRGAFTLDADLVKRWIVEAESQIQEQRDFLTQLDAAIGDADHGINMHRGFVAAVATVDGSTGSPGALLEAVGTTLVHRVGGAAGPLFGTGFRRIGSVLEESIVLDAEALLASLRAGTRGRAGSRCRRSGRQDDRRCLGPRGGGVRVRAALRRLCPRRHSPGGGGRERGVATTLPMQARKGRASYLGARSVGHQDPGATSTALLFVALERAARPAT